MFSPFIHKLEKGKSDVLLTSKKNIVTSSTISLPLISLGFHAFLHRTKDAMNITKKIDMKNDFYYIVNSFEQNIPNYNDSLSTMTKLYFGIKDNIPDIISSDFYKMWEILLFFNIANTKELTYASLSNNPEPFIQSIIKFREKLLNGVEKDKVFSVSINNNIFQTNEYAEVGKQFLGYHNMKNPGLLKQTKQTGGKNDINVIKTISNFKKDITKSKKYADLVTADGSLVWSDNKFQEQESYQLILGEIIGCLNVQKKNGHFVLRLFESFTYITIKLIYLLTSFYEECYIYKPFYSRNSDSERYLICKNFIYDQDNDKLNKMIESLEEVMKGINSNSYLYDIYPDLILPQEYLNKIKFINVKIANAQQIMINDIITYIKENNYFGEKYHNMRENQITSTKWWVSQFYPPSSNLYDKTKEDLKKIMDITLQKNDMEYNKFISVLV
jgi:23S rRNA U2552 (ribose-2'-O)-methylase RlmE/FtsJ